MPDESLTPDELASALLDQEVAPPAPVDPALAARVEQFGAVAAQVGAPVPVDPDRREQAIAAALAEFDTARDGADVDAVSAAPTPLRPRRPVGLRVLGAAAAVVVVLGAVTLLRRDETSVTDTAASGAATTAQGEGGAERLSGATDVGGDAAAAESAPTTQASDLGALAPEAANDAAATPSPAPTSAARDLGEVDSGPSLLSQFESFATNADDDGPPPSTICEPEARAASTVALEALVDSATLRWQDRPARALVFATGDSNDTMIIVVSDPSCEVLAQID
jgi:hypothetical protein